MHVQRIEGGPRGPGAFVVPSSTHPRWGWLVEAVSPSVVYCYCPAFALRGDCRHADAARVAWRDEMAPSPRVLTADERDRMRRRVREIEELFSR